MYIFIDEAGSFTSPQAKSWNISAVGAVIIPENNIKNLFKDFSTLKKNWGYIGEIKGSKLNEEQVNSFLLMISKYDIFFETVVIDMGNETSKEISKHKLTQIKKIGTNITQDATDSAKKFTITAKEKTANLPNQLYVQMQLTISLIENILQKSIMYYAKNNPKTLKNFHWFVDSKNPNKTTAVEELWRDLVLPMTQSRSLSNPVIFVKDRKYNYSYFFEKRTMKDIPKYMLDKVGDLEPKDMYDPKTIFYKKIKFKESQKCLGIQIADILTTTLRRSMSDTLQMEGWQNLGRVMFKLGNQQTISMITFSNTRIKKEKYYYKVFDIMNVTAKNILQD